MESLFICEGYYSCDATEVNMFFCLYNIFINASLLAQEVADIMHLDFVEK